MPFELIMRGRPGIWSWCIPVRCHIKCKDPKAGVNLRGWGDSGSERRDQSEEVREGLE